MKPRTPQSMIALSLLTLFLTLVQTPLAVASETVSSDELNLWLSALAQFEARFEQRSYNELGVLAELSSGQLAIARPSRFRWDYETPFEQMILADGKQLWIYDIEMEQITVRSLADSMEALPSVLLSGEVDEILKTFSLTRKESKQSEQKESVMVLTLVPKQPTELLERVQLTLSSDSYQPKKLEIYDSYGRLTLLHFEKYQPLLENDFDRFKMQIPSDVDVVGQPQ